MAMATSIQLPTSDLRRHGIEAKRVHTHKAKWAHGARQPKFHGPGSLGARTTTAEQVQRVRPAPQAMWSQPARAHLRRENESTLKSLSRATKINFQSDLRDELFHPSDSSADEEAELDIDTTTSTPVGDAGIFYSYDAMRAPGQGSCVLAQALEKAVNVFEDKETQRVVGEYEIVDVREETGGDAEWEDEEGFEIVGRDDF